MFAVTENSVYYITGGKILKMDPETGAITEDPKFRGCFKSDLSIGGVSPGSIMIFENERGLAITTSLVMKIIN